MPYLNGLASQYGLAESYFANVHPSIGNYFMLTTGWLEAVNDGFNGTISGGNIVRQLVKANKTWHSHAASLPNARYVGGDVYPYLRHQDPFTYLSDVKGTAQANNIVPFTQFSGDVNAGNLPDYSFVIPNALNDDHDGTLIQADQWFETNIDPFIKSNALQNNGVLIILFDESALTDLSHGGGHVVMIVAGPKVKKNSQSTTTYQHQSTLRFVLSTLGENSFPGAAAAAPDMGEFFQ